LELEETGTSIPTLGFVRIGHGFGIFHVIF
jgi:hypothetical protein